MSEQRITVRGILVKDGKIFTARRAMTKRFHPGIYELPGGWVEFGEALEDALRREFKEECEIDIRVGELVYAGTQVLQDKHLAEFNYFVEFIDESQPIVLHSEDHSDICWWTQAEFEGEWDPSHPDYLAMKKAFNVLSSTSFSSRMAEE